MTRRAGARFARPGFQAGFSLLEVVLVIALVMILFLVAHDRLLPLLGEAEAAHVAQVEGAVRSGLGLAVAELAVRDGLDTLDTLDGANPVRFLESPPANYAGEIAGSSTPSPGQWVFHAPRGELMYAVQRPQFLSPPARAPVILTWRIQATSPRGGRPSVGLKFLGEGQPWGQPELEVPTRSNDPR